MYPPALMKAFEFKMTFDLPQKGAVARREVRNLNFALDLWDKTYPHLDRYFGMEVIEFNWERGVRDLEELICLEQYTNQFADCL